MELGDLYAATREDRRVSLLFGSEADGLTTEELSSATHVCEIPTSPTQGSLNLSHAVAISLARVFEDCLAAGEWQEGLGGRHTHTTPLHVNPICALLVSQRHSPPITTEVRVPVIRFGETHLRLMKKTGGMCNNAIIRSNYLRKKFILPLNLLYLLEEIFLYFVYYLCYCLPWFVIRFRSQLINAGCSRFPFVGGFHC
jgi:hypothetical protein